MGISAFGSEETTKNINQNVLSAKHLLTTSSEKIEFNDNFDKFFSIIGDEIVVKFDDNDEIENYAIYIDDNDISKAEDFDDNALYNTLIDSGKFYVSNMVTGETFVIEEKNNKELFLTEKCIELATSGKGWIKFKDIDDGESLFVIDILNNELTKPLYEIMNLVNKVNKDYKYTIDEMVQKLIELLIESNIPAYAVQIELIVNRLIRDVNDIYHRPNFKLNKMPEYEILTVNKALINHPSVFVSLSFQELKRQILSDELFYDKKDAGYLDPFFKKKIKNTLKSYKKKK